MQTPTQQGAVYTHSIALMASADALPPRLIPMIALATIVAATSASATHPIAYSKTEVEALVTAADYPAYSATITALGAPAESVPKGESKTRAVTLRVEQIYAGRGMKVGELVIRDYPEPPPKVDIASQTGTPPHKVTAGRRTFIVVPVDGGPIEDVAWQGVIPGLGLKLLILERGGVPRILAAEPDASPVAARIRELTQVNRRAVGDPRSLLDRVATLNPKADPLETIYFIEAPISRVVPDIGVEVLTRLLRKDGFTPEQRSKIAGHFCLLWFQCTPEVKASSLERFVRLAAVPDYESARPLVSLLLGMRSYGVPVELPQLKPVVSRQLMANYERLVTSGSRRNPAFEATLNRMAGAK